MTENNRPWDFNKIKIGINPEVKAMMNYNAKFRNDMSSMVGSSFKDIQVAGMGLYRGNTLNTAAMAGESILSLRNTIEDATNPIRATALVGESLIRIKQSITPFPLAALPSVRAIESLSEAIQKQQGSNITRLVDNMKQASAFNLASSLKVNTLTLGINIAADVEADITDEIIPVEIPRDVVHKKLKEEAEKEQEEISAEVPYNVLSMGFIFNVYLPCINIADILENTETIDADFAVRFILFTVLPFVNNFITQRREPETKAIDFDKDVIIKEEE